MILPGSSIDFDSDPFNITIDSGLTIGSYNLSITCDKVVEHNESFNLTMSLTFNNDQIVIGQSTSIVQITDSTGKQNIYHYKIYVGTYVAALNIVVCK